VYLRLRAQGVSQVEGSGSTFFWPPRRFWRWSRNTPPDPIAEEVLLLPPCENNVLIGQRIELSWGAFFSRKECRFLISVVAVGGKRGSATDMISARKVMSLITTITRSQLIQL